MQKALSLSIAAALLCAVGISATLPAMAADAAAATVQVQGEKIDSGLGELPHYSQWADPTGKQPLRRASAAKATLVGEKKDSGLGELPHYRYWADVSGRQAVQVSQAK